MKKFLSRKTVLIFFLGIVFEFTSFLVGYSDLLNPIQKIVAPEIINVLTKLNYLMESNRNELLKGEKGFDALESFIINDISRVESNIWQKETSQKRTEYSKRAQKHGLTKIELRSEGRSDRTFRPTPPNNRVFRIVINEIWRGDKLYSFHIYEQPTIKHFESKLKIRLFLFAAIIFIAGVLIQIYAFFAQESITTGCT